ncbi:MAG: primase C-terminal domain-containing protein, partial [Chloroflexi bacterium]|nr:primase C-terminal domain-containing protein [Chloroflexota bacterium]
MATKASAGGLALPPPGDIPAELRQRDQWVGWIYGDAGRKLPLNPKTGKAASVADSETWTPFEIAYRYAQKRRCGLGFVFTAGDDLCGADFDDCRSTDDGSIKIGVWQTIEALASYSEVSPSGTGIKIICRAKLPQPFKGARLELYDRARFFTITGQHVRGTPTAINEAQGAIDVLLAEHSRGNGHRTEPIPEAIQEGQRNAVLTSLAGSLRARGLGQGVIEMALEGVNAAQCQPPLSEGEVKSIAQSIARYPAPISLHLTDLGNAERLVARHGHDLHYCYAWA